MRACLVHVEALITLTQQIKLSNKLSYCFADAQQALPASSPLGSPVWSSEVPLCCSSSSVLLLLHPPSLSASPNIGGNLGTEPSGSFSTRSLQMWWCSPPAAGTEYYEWPNQTEIMEPNIRSMLETLTTHYSTKSSMEIIVNRIDLK